MEFKLVTGNFLPSLRRREDLSWTSSLHSTSRLDPSGNTLITTNWSSPTSSQQSHERHGLSSSRISHVLLLQRRDDGHVGTVPQLRDAGLHVLRTVGHDDGDVLLHGGSGRVHVPWAGGLQLTKCVHLPEFFVPLPRYVSYFLTIPVTNRSSFREFLSVVHSNATFSSQLSHGKTLYKASQVSWDRVYTVHVHVQHTIL